MRVTEDTSDATMTMPRNAEAARRFEASRRVDQLTMRSSKRPQRIELLLNGEGPVLLERRGRGTGEIVGPGLGDPVVDAKKCGRDASSPVERISSGGSTSRAASRVATMTTVAAGRIRRTRRA